ncbi:GAF domain-containing protein [Gordonia sp. TBRC 11910]|uniref:GAF domain-containing protein n=1 Tax=Gordonia asplenii TaxID=2725283 RepID=A0A848L417_9ACTN|nr:helix-turn-helix domain-containing protein [Gordonia asplenii]NMO05172.1 GAF domain-containing protein [Gordonia asplenii]
MRRTEVTAELERLLATIVDDPAEAEAAVRQALDDVGDVGLLRREDLTWIGTDAAAEPELDQASLAALECGGGALVSHAAFAGDYAIILPDSDTGADVELFSRVCVWLTFIRSLAAARTEVSDYHYETVVVGGLAKHVLSVSDLDQVLLTITAETLRMSESDICGVFLREGDELRMKSCTGHRVVDTARLRMRRGQGVAGMVFETLQPAKVDSYLQDHRISNDFMSLAEQEETRSALAVPLILGDDLVGVLEVWRRRYSSFTQRDVRRLEALADLATIAIDNARLYDSQRSALADLEVTHARLEAQVRLLDETAQLQKSLIDIVLENGPVFNRVARTLAEQLGCTVAVVTADGEIDAIHPRDCDSSAIVSAFLAQRDSLNRSATLTTAGGAPVWVHPIKLGADQFGAVCAQGLDLGGDLSQVACAHAALACSLFLLQQRAASVARSEALDQVLWDLMDGSAEQRSAAGGRAQQMGVWLRGWHRVLYGSIDNLDSFVQQEEWSLSAADRTRRAILDSVRNTSTPVQPTLASVRGNWIVALVPIHDRDRAREYLRSLKAALSAEHAPIAISWGLSTAREQPSQYPEAFAEARTALAAARRLGSVSLYDDLGIVRLLLGNEDADFQSFVREITGPLQDYDDANDGALMKTLRAYFDSNCSQKDAAQLLYIHHKTLAYRLDRIRKLTGLDLSQHSDRMRADLALRLLEVSEQAEGDG